MPRNWFEGILKPDVAEVVRLRSCSKTYKPRTLTSSATKTIERTGQHGATLVAVLVCLIVVTALGAALLRTIVSRHRQMRQQQIQLQAVWLAQSALDRAVVRLQKSSEYDGETWRVAAEQFSGDKPGAAMIRVEPVEGLPGQRRVLIEAIYPDDPQFRVRETKELIVNLPDEGDAS